MTGVAKTIDDESLGPSAAWRRAEIAVAILITCAAGWLHVIRAGKAGGLWRDEAGAVNLAQLPSLGEVAANLHHEAFPILFSLMVRAFTFVTGGSDAALRVFGCVVGLGLLGMLWFAARAVHGGPPLLSLALLGINASAIQWVDWMRGHGLGTVLILLTFALVWKLATRPSPLLAVLTSLAAIASVQTLYYNAVLLFAIGVAGAAVAARRGHWQRALVILAVGGAAAASLVPYLQISRRAGESSFIYTVAEFPLSLFWSKLREALSGTAPFVEWVWVALALVAVALAVTALRRKGRSGSDGAPNASLYCAIILLVMVPAYFAFLSFLKYQTQPWYYVPLMAVAAVAIDGIGGGVLQTAPGRGVRAAVAMMIAIWSFYPASNAIQVRQTNVDLAAGELSEIARAEDLVVVMPWYLGVPFGRYYSGAAEWITVPPIADRKLQRYDLLKQQMTEPDPLEPVIAALGRALQGGGRVWLVGQLAFPESDVPPPILPPAPHPTEGWSEGAYLTSWNLRTMHFLQTRVLRAEEVPIAIDQPVNRHENIRVVVVQGWRGGAGVGE